MYLYGDLFSDLLLCSVKIILIGFTLKELKHLSEYTYRERQSENKAKRCLCVCPGSSWKALEMRKQERWGLPGGGGEERERERKKRRKERRKRRKERNITEPGTAILCPFPQGDVIYSKDNVLQGILLILLKTGLWNICLVKYSGGTNTSKGRHFCTICLETDNACPQLWHIRSSQV